MNQLQFVLEINLDNAEVADAGIDSVLPHYLAQVAQRAATGSADAGRVVDGNGNTIGYYFTDDGGELIRCPRCEYLTETLQDLRKHIHAQHP